MSKSHSIWTPNSSIVRCGNSLDALTFRTNMGRTVSYGNMCGGQEMAPLKAPPGQMITGLVRPQGPGTCPPLQSVEVLPVPAGCGSMVGATAPPRSTGSAAAAPSGDPNVVFELTSAVLVGDSTILVARHSYPARGGSHEGCNALAMRAREQAWIRKSA